MAKKRNGEASAAAEKADGYTVGKWGEFKRYQCDRCPYDSLELPDIEAHVYETHVRPTLRDPNILLYDADGNPVYGSKSNDTEE